LVIDSSGIPGLTYQAYYFGLRYAVRSESGWTCQQLTNSHGSDSLALDSQDHPRIANYTQGHTLEYREWTGTAWTSRSVDGTSDVGAGARLAMDLRDDPHIAYYDITNGDLKYAQRSGSAWSVQTLDSAGNVGEGASIAIGPDDRVHITYYDRTNGDLRYAVSVPVPEPCTFVLLSMGAAAVWFRRLFAR